MTTLFSPYPGRKYHFRFRLKNANVIVFGTGMVKNSICNTGIKRATPEHMFDTLAFGSGDNLHMLWTGQLITSIVA